MAAQINPIIQAMIASSQREQQQNELKQKAQQASAENKIATQRQAADQQRVQQEQQRLENEHSYQTETLKNATALLTSQLAQHQVEQVKDIQNLNNVPGFNINAALQSVGHAPIAGLQSPEAQNAAIANAKAQEAQQVAGATTTGQLAAAEPYNIAKEERTKQAEKDKLQQESLNRINEENNRGADARRLADINNAASMSRTRLESGTHLEGIRLSHQLGLDDGSGQNTAIAGNLVNGIFNGQTDASKLTTDQKRAIQPVLAAEGSQLPSDGKAYKQTLDSVQGLQNLVSQFRDAAQKYSIDAPQGGVGKLNENGQLFGLVPKSDVNATKEGLEASGGQLAKTFEAQNRNTAENIKRQITGMFDPKLTIQQNLKNINEKSSLINTSLQSLFSGINPDRVNTVLQGRGIVDFGGFQQKPSWLQSAPKTNKSGHTLDEDESLKRGQPVYK